MDKKYVVAIIVALVLVAVFSLISMRNAGSSSDRLSAEQQQMTSRLDEIVKKTGGDWSKLTPEDRDYLVNEISYGNEYSARMLFDAKAGNLRRVTPGPPPGSR